ncbi:unnamed protein product, partial [Didymodactylos carnosus]
QWLLRYHHIVTKKNFSLPVFAFVFTKMNINPPFIEIQLYNSSNLFRCNSLDKAIETVQECQITCFKKYEFKQKFVSGGETPTIDFFDTKTNLKRYQIIATNSKTKYKQLFAAFIVPKGRNRDWLFATSAGRQDVINSAKYNCLIFIYLQSDQIYIDLDQVKAETSSIVVDFKPVNLPHNTKIPFLSSAEGIGDVHMCERSASELSGPYLIEDCKYENEWKRRLIFESNPTVIQSEVNLKVITNEAGDISRIPDHSILNDDYHGAILCCLQALYMDQKNLSRILLIGLGGGILGTKLAKTFPQTSLTGIDIDSEIVKIGKKWFGFDESDERIQSIVIDGLEFLATTSQQSKQQYDTIILDVNNGDPQSPLRCPAPSFLDEQVLKNIKSSLTETGLFVMNFASRTSDNRSDCIKKLMSY